MASKSVTDLARAHQWYAGPNQAFGLFRGYQVNLLYGGKMASPQFKSVQFTTTTMNDRQTEAVTDALERLKAELKFKEFAVTPEIVLVTYYETWKPASQEKLQRTLDGIADALAEQEVGPSFSEVGEELGHYIINGGGVVLPRSEVGNVRQQLERNQKDREYRETSYGQGALGAFLFGSGGVVVWVVVAYLFSVYFAAVALGIAFLSYFGYQKFNGVTGPWTKPLLIVVNLLLIFLAVFFTYYVMFQEYERVSLSETWMVLTSDPEMSRSFYGDLGIATLFMGIGIWSMVSSVDTRGDYLEEAQPV